MRNLIGGSHNCTRAATKIQVATTHAYAYLPHILEEQHNEDN